MPQIISTIKDDLQVVLLMSCLVGHPVCIFYMNPTNKGLTTTNENSKTIVQKWNLSGVFIIFLVPCAAVVSSFANL